MKIIIWNVPISWQPSLEKKHEQIGSFKKGMVIEKGTSLEKLLSPNTLEYIIKINWNTIYPQRLRDFI